MNSCTKISVVFMVICEREINKLNITFFWKTCNYASANAINSAVHFRSILATTARVHEHHMESSISQSIIHKNLPDIMSS